MDRYDLIVVGGGPAGLIAAGQCANAGLKVILIEKMRMTGRKLGITGKGRCNITNTATIEEFISKIHPDGRFMRSSFSRFFNDDLIEFMNSIGIETESERGGRVFPTSGKATDIVRKLNSWVLKSGVNIVTGSKVTGLIRTDKGISGVETVEEYTPGKKSTYFSDCVLLATGGQSYPATGSTGDGYRFAKECGHSITDRFPSLVPLETKNKYLPLLKGLNLRNVKATVLIDGEYWNEAFGELNFTENSITGPIVLSLSRGLAAYLNKRHHIVLSIDLKPALDINKLDARMLRDIEMFGKLKTDELLRKLVPGSLTKICINQLSLNQSTRGSELDADTRRKIVFWLKNFKLIISGHRPYSEAIITSGGVDINEVDQKTFMSKKIDGLYIAGELLDLDGPTGGYNLQIAFTTGWCAAEAIIKKPR